MPKPTAHVNSLISRQESEWALHPGDPARDAIAASDGLAGRDRRGSGWIFGHEKGRPMKAARTGLGEKLSDVFGVCVVKIQLGAVLQQFGD